MSSTLVDQVCWQEGHCSSSTTEALQAKSGMPMAAPASAGPGLCKRLQHQGLYMAAEAMARRQLKLPEQHEQDTWHYLLALSLDAQGRSTEAAACYALALEAVVAQLLITAPRGAQSQAHPL